MRQKHYTTKWFLLAFLCMIGIGQGKADENKTFINGLYYILNNTDKTAQVTFYSDQFNYNELYGYNKDYVKDTLRIPNIVTYESATYTVTSIGYSAFNHCTSLTSVVIPNTVKVIGSYAFDGCSKLSSVNIPDSVTVLNNSVFQSCGSITSFNIPKSIKTISDRAFAYSGLTSITIPDSVTTLGGGAFENCKSLKSLYFNARKCKIVYYYLDDPFQFSDALTDVVFGDSVIEIPGDLFSRCGTVSSITIGKSVTTIGKGAFDNTIWYNNQPEGIVYAGLVAYNYKGSLSSNTITIKDGTRGIANRAFEGLSSIRFITIPSSIVRIGECAFNKCSNLSLVYLSSVVPPDFDRDIFAGTSDDLMIYFPKSGALEYASTPINIYFYNNYYNGKTFNEETTVTQTTATIKFPANTQVKGLIGNKKVYDIDANKTVKLTGLWPSTTVDYYPFVNSPTNDGFISLFIGYYFRTRDIDVRLSNQSTQTKLILKPSISLGDEMLDSLYLMRNGYNYKYKLDENGLFKIEGLNPGESHSYTLYVKTKDGYEQKLTGDFSTKTVAVNLKNIKLTSTSVRATASYDVGDAQFLRFQFSKGEVSDDSVLLSGLEPETNYSLTLDVYVSANGYQLWKPYSYTYSFTTPSPNGKALPADHLSSNSAIIHATINCDETATTGFEWRAYDAPELVPSTMVPCPAIDGAMDVSVRGLSTSKYYKYRPFLKGPSGKVYYGDWIAFGTADAYVYFAPVVKTYTTKTVSSEGTEVTLVGQAIAGSDDIQEEGFEYWETGSNSKGFAGKGNTQRVLCSGTLMKYTLSDLKKGTTYYYRSFVKTSKETVYGEQQSFSTVPTGINDVVADGFTAKLSENPVKNEAKVILSGTMGKTLYRIVTVNGQVMKTGTIAAGTTEVALDVAGFQPGMYIVQLQNGNDEQVVKMIVK